MSSLRSPLQNPGASAVFLALAAACGSATQPGSAVPRVTEPAAGVPSAPSPEPACGDGRALEPGVGCVFIADGSPPPGASSRPIPEGVVGRDGERRTVQSFWMDQRKVRVSEYRACVEEGVCTAISGGHCASVRERAASTPMTCATWEQAGAYCAWAKKRLATDDEWERVIQQRELFGLEDLGGPAEWTASYYCDDRIGGCGHSRVVRIGPQADGRSRQSPTTRSSLIGFRCVWSERPPPAGPQPRPQGPVTATTPGAIACNTDTCELATEACCLNPTDGIGSCVAKDGTCGEAAFVARCDENADCRGNDVCCLRANDSSSLPPVQVCQPAPCDGGTGACLPGGECATGFRCSTEWPGRQGRCEWQDVGARCGEKRCSGGTPVCCWDEQRGAGECSESACALDKRRYACTGPQDCGGRVCVAEASGGRQGEDPDPGFECGAIIDRVSAVLCRTRKDCRTSPSGARPEACRHTRELPPGVKRCVYVNEP